MEPRHSSVGCQVWALQILESIHFPEKKNLCPFDYMKIFLTFHIKLENSYIVIYPNKSPMLYIRTFYFLNNRDSQVFVVDLGYGIISSLH